MNISTHRWAIVVSVGLALGLVAGGSVARAQELTPRAYWPAPKGVNLLILGYMYSAGDVLTDPALPVIGTDSRLNFAQFGYQRTFGLSGRSASVLVSVPYVFGTSKDAALDRRRVGRGSGRNGDQRRDRRSEARRFCRKPR